MRWVFRFILLCVTLVVACAGGIGGPAWADESQFAEYEVKGAFLYKFAKFTEWPPQSFPNPATPISICIFGRNPFGETLNTLKNVQVQGRPLTVQNTTRIEDLKGCHVVFVCGSEKKRFEEVLGAVKALPVLTIGEVDEFTRKDGAVAFITAGNKVQLEVNLEAVGRSGLKIGSQLLVVARIVRQ